MELAWQEGKCFRPIHICQWGEGPPSMHKSGGYDFNEGMLHYFGQRKSKASLAMTNRHKAKIAAWVRRLYTGRHKFK